MKEKSTDFVSYKSFRGGSKKKNRPTILEAAKTLSKVAFSGFVSKCLSYYGTASKGGQWEGNTLMVCKRISGYTHKNKEQIRQEAAGLEEAIRLQAQMDEEVAKQIHLDKMLAKRVQEEQELSEQQLKRKLEQETLKKQKIDIQDASITKGKDKVVREAYVKEKVKEDASSESEIKVDVIPTATKPPTIINWKIISQSSQKAAYQIIRKDGSDKIYMSFGAMLKDFSRDELVELYKLVIKKYGANYHRRDAMTSTLG
ncbi:hypothetical protein Tco_1355032 [Tanacetum coccineum]